MVKNVLITLLEIVMINLKKTFRLASIQAFTFFTFQAVALEPAPVRFGIIDFVPTLHTDILYTDNMFLSSDNEQSSSLVLLKPKIVATISRGPDNYSSTLEIQNGNYSATREDDYADWKIATAAHIELDVRNIVDLEAEYFNTHEVRGTGFSQGDFFTPVPDKFNTSRLTARYQYGTDESRGRIVLDVAGFRKIYSNNPLTTFFRDREDGDLAGTFYLGTLTRTDILFQYRYRKINYLNDPEALAGLEDSLDSRETYVFTGLTWQATAKTSGTIKAGYGKKDFIDPDRTDTSGPSWEVQLHWEPLSYSVVELTTGRAFGEQSGIGSGLDSRSVSINWQHKWSRKVTSMLSTSHSSDTYVNSERSDSVRSLTARIEYAVDTWLDLFAAIGNDTRQSVLNAFNYEQATFNLGFSVSL
jgi:polysaccharide biosynthesis protein VpsM